jgi:hypothetical protein
MLRRNQLLQSRNTALSIARRQAGLDPSLRAVSRLWRPKVRLVNNVIGVCTELQVVNQFLSASAMNGEMDIGGTREGYGGRKLPLARFNAPAL